MSRKTAVRVTGKTNAQDVYLRQLNFPLRRRLGHPSFVV